MQLPLSFIENQKALLGEDEYAMFFDALNAGSPVSIRKNTLCQLENDFNNTPVSWCKMGMYLNKRPLFTADPLFHTGAYYVQEASSMFIEQAVKQYIKNPIIALDMCASPGGKSTHLSSILSTESLLVSNEFVKSRVGVLLENITKWGNGNVVVTSNSSADFKALGEFFDLILVDAPCSGEGMFRKDNQAISEWSTGNVDICVSRQKEILDNAWQALKNEGFLLYSTCTYNKKENEENVQWLINEFNAEYLPINTSTFPEITVSEYGYRFFPHKAKGEGLFVALLRKNNITNNSKRIKVGKAKKILQNHNILSSYFKDISKWIFIQEGSMYKAMPQKYIDEIDFLHQNLSVVSSGIAMFEQKGQDFIPQHALAMYKDINIQSLNIVDVSWQTAISYLKKETIQLPQSSKGYILLTYKNIALGWVKNIGERCNNLYPSSWKIRMNILPEHYSPIIKFKDK